MWIRDSDLDNLEGIHIDYPPWVAKARGALAGTWADQTERAKATSGVLAPVGTLLELKGAWITPAGDECRDPSKAQRATDIRDYGYT